VKRATGTAGWLAVLCVAGWVGSAGDASAKPTAPIRLTATVTDTDPVSRTAGVRITAHSPLKAGTLSVGCELPPGAAVVPGSSEWGRDPAGRPALTMRVTLPPGGGKLVVKAEVRGARVRLGVVARVALPAAGAPKPPAEHRRVVRTSKGERLRLHR